MSKKLRKQREIRRLIELGRPLSAVRQDIDGNGEPYHIAATLRKVGEQYELLIDTYKPIGVTGETISEEGKSFVDIENAIYFLEHHYAMTLDMFTF